MLNNVHRKGIQSKPWNGVRVHNDVGIDALLGKWHVFLAVRDTACSFLTVTTSKFVANLRIREYTMAECIPNSSYLRDSDRAHSNFHKLIAL